MRLHIRTQHADYRGIAYILHIYTHMPYSILTSQISLQLTHTHSFIVSAYLGSIVWYIRFMYGDLVQASHQSCRFTAKSWHLFTYHADRTIISAACVIIYRPAGCSAVFWKHVWDLDSLLAEYAALLLPINFSHSQAFWGGPSLSAARCYAWAILRGSKMCTVTFSSNHTYVHRETHCIYQRPELKVVWAQSKSRFSVALDLVLVKPECPSWAPGRLWWHCCWITADLSLCVCVCVWERDRIYEVMRSLSDNAHTKWSQIETLPHIHEHEDTSVTGKHTQTRIHYTLLFAPPTHSWVPLQSLSLKHTHIHRGTDGHVEHLSSCIAHSRTPSSHELIGKAIKGSTGPAHWRNVLFCYLASKLTKPVRSHLADTT